MFALRSVLVILAVVAGPASAAPVVTGSAPEVIDWTRGSIIARGAASASPRAPSAAVARVGAERSARQAARAELRRRVDALAWAAGTTVGAAAAAGTVERQRLDAVLEASRAVQVTYGTDGSAVVLESVPLEAVRVALTGPAPPPTSFGADAPTAILIVAPKKSQPTLGLAVVSGSARYVGPTVFHRTARAAAADPRVGARVLRGVAAALDAGALSLGDGIDETALAAARDSGALVVVVLPGS
jgi:hypothetical protein